MFCTRSRWDLNACLTVAIVLLASQAPAQPQVCVGDCDSDAQVTVNEIITMVNVALGSAAANDCSAGDVNHDGAITVNEIIIAVNNALDGCPGATATPTPSTTPSPSLTPTPAAATVFHATLTGDQETPPNLSAATGTAVFTLSAEATTLTYDISVSGIDPQQITAAHIHVAPPGTPGAIVLSLSAGRAGTSFHGTLGAADLLGAPGVTTFAAFVAKLRAGETYVNVHTQNFSGGEIRGQIGFSVFRATLNGDQETPPVSTAATGSALFLLSEDASSLLFALTTNGIDQSQISAAHIHVAPVGTPGPIIFPLANGPFASPLQGRLDAADLQPDPDIGVNNFGDFVDRLRAGDTYINVHTIAHSGGELRGQIGAPVQN